MKSQLLFTFAYIIGFSGLLLICEILHRKYNVHAEYTRKIGHSVSTLVTLFFPLIFHSCFYVAVIGIFAFTLLFIGRFFRLFGSIDSVERKTGGSYLLPVSVCLLYFLSCGNNLFFILPVLVLGISDPLACIFGTLLKDKTKNVILFKHEFNKTLIGSLVFFISAFIISVIVLHFYLFSSEKMLLMSFCIACFAAFIEFISPKGTDNITVPQSVFILLYLQQLSA